MAIYESNQAPPHLTLVSSDGNEPRPSRKSGSRNPTNDERAEIERLMGQAFFAQEGEIRDLYNMARVTYSAMVDRDLEDQRLFCATKLLDMIVEFRTQYLEEHTDARRRVMGPHAD